ncbi:alpha-2-HS-glycoprotein-like [Phyllopteryx taeniolatus]|uniref:alpha-2-HS-glycoprotein-like n=1 Tax=Phyllopteryx taeniolatus TaxID=161469 RepID=UPI002AD28125|nr:alpha-2-HS-glycoprotein-like [Phyllopteryx taeniolatus]
MATHLLAVLLCCAAALPGIPAQPSPEVTCGEDGAEAAAGLAVRHINEHHRHGFKFRLHEIQSSNYQQFPGGCHIDVNVKLAQTKCHITDPKPLDRCQLWRRNERGAVATCSVEFWVMWGAARITRHECTTRPEHTNEELMTICPSCPKLLALNDPTGVSAVDAAVTAFNRDGQRQNYFTLMEVAQLTEEYVAGVGTITWLKFALVETTCPREATSSLAACTPRCPDRANHVFCQTSYYNVHRQVGELSCETYPPKNSAALPAGEPEPVCRPLFHKSAEACVCQARLKKPDAAVHHICPFPLK